MKILLNIAFLAFSFTIQHALGMDVAKPMEDARIQCPIESVRPQLQKWVNSCDKIADYANREIIYLLSTQSKVGNIEPRELTQTERITLTSWQTIQERLNKLCIEGLEVLTFPLWLASRPYYQRPSPNHEPAFGDDLFKIELNQAGQLLFKSGQVFNQDFSSWWHCTRLDFTHIGDRHFGVCFLNNPGTIPIEMQMSSLNHPNAFKAFLSKLEEFRKSFLDQPKSHLLLPIMDLEIATLIKSNKIYQTISLTEVFENLRFEEDRDFIKLQLQDVQALSQTREKLIEKLQLESVTIECKHAEAGIRRSVSRDTNPETNIDVYEQRLDKKKAELNVDLAVQQAQVEIVTKRIEDLSRTEPAHSKVLIKLTLMKMSIERTIHTIKKQLDFINTQKDFSRIFKDLTANRNQYAKDLTDSKKEVDETVQILGGFLDIFHNTNAIRIHNLSKIKYKPK